ELYRRRRITPHPSRPLRRDAPDLDRSHRIPPSLPQRLTVSFCGRPSARWRPSPAYSGVSSQHARRPGMTRRRVASTAAASLVWLALLPSAANAQSAIAGVVRDASGAVLPGVTVEASSDVLIERTRSVVTNGQGQFNIVDLRPGVYSLSFTLPGFSVFKRDGVELPANFTATINAEMKVGALEESVTVSGQSPVVDVQSTARTTVLSREVLDSIPTGRTIQRVTGDDAGGRDDGERAGWRRRGPELLQQHDEPGDELPDRRRRHRRVGRR